MSLVQYRISIKVPSAALSLGTTSTRYNVSTSSTFAGARPSFNELSYGQSTPSVSSSFSFRSRALGDSMIKFPNRTTCQTRSYNSYSTGRLSNFDLNANKSNTNNKNLSGLPGQNLLCNRLSRIKFGTSLISHHKRHTALIIAGNSNTSLKSLQNLNNQIRIFSSSGSSSGDNRDMFTTSSPMHEGMRGPVDEPKTETVTIEVIPALTTLQRRRYALQCAIPMVAFGFMDNLIMITIGDIIDSHFSAFVSTLTAAAMGQCCSDVCGTSFGGVIDALFAKAGLINDARVSPAQADLLHARVIRMFSMAIGVITGCILGMAPLIFIDTKRNERIKQSKELRTLFKSIAEEGQRSLNVERCSLYIDEDGDASALWALAKKWTPSRDQLDDCIRRSQVEGQPTKLSVRTLENRFKEMRFKRSKLPTDQEFIHPDELPMLLKRMLGGGDKLEKKKIKKNDFFQLIESSNHIPFTVKTPGTKYILLRAEDPELVLNIRDVYEDPRFSKSRKYSTDARTASEDAWRAHSVLIGPVTREGKIVGCIEMINKKSLPDLEGGCVPFSKNDERLMKLLCNHCSIFLNQLETWENISDILTVATELNDEN